ncbi:MAG TPA: hypothetical protein VEY30_13775, partial [Myxococcaceae bacterium]|nr:hypothetical protein [Myxococcaceae bacterium]
MNLPSFQNRLLLVALVATFLGLASAGCRDTATASGTALFISVEVPETLGALQLVFEGKHGDVVTFGPERRPAVADQALTGAQSVRVLLPDALAGEVVEVNVVGVAGAQRVGYATGRTSVRQGREVELSLTLNPGEPPAPDGGVPGVAYRPICSESRWCWENPLPQGNTLQGAWAVAANDVYAVGARGTVLRWDGVGWSRESLSTTEALEAVWAGTSNDVWVVGQGGYASHWDGKGWTEQRPGGQGLHAI